MGNEPADSPRGQSDEPEARLLGHGLRVIFDKLESLHGKVDEVRVDVAGIKGSLVPCQGRQKLHDAAIEDLHGRVAKVEEGRRIHLSVARVGVNAIATAIAALLGAVAAWACTKL